jgi:metallo-beta-lactamase family protein
MKLTFLGGAGTVTGSKYLLAGGKKRLLVDCGLFQGYKNLRLRNWNRLPLAPSGIDAVILTHAHLDHSGYLPLLARQGFRGKIFCTPPTRDLCKILLPDSGRLQEQDAEFANRHGFSRHKPALPLYDEKDAERALKLLEPVDFDTGFAPADGAVAQFVRAGHILGAASLVLEIEGKTIVFSGDIGRYGDPLMPDPVTPERADYLLIESTYGDRLHSGDDPQRVLEQIIRRTVDRGGTIIVPAFAVGRAQMLLYHLGRLKAAGRLPPHLPIYLNSPMAIDATEIFNAHPDDRRAEAKVDFGAVRYVRTADESKAINVDPTPKLIISASGMATGGRVLHHLARYAPDARNTILFTGFQAGGTRGAAMVAGAASVKIHGRYVPIKAEVHNLEMLSAHADRGELLRWARGLGKAPARTFVVHGEAGAADGFRKALEEELHWDCMVPAQDEEVEL